MSTEIVPFSFEGVGVRTLMIDGEPWFVATDVAAVLDLGNPRSSLALLEADEKGVHTVDTLRGRQTVTVINEPGLYSLIIRSRKEEARQFKRWITHEVLPALRKTGTYTTAEKTPLELIRDQHTAITQLLAANEEITARAVQAESTVEYIEGSEGLSVREFHKQYFSDTPEKVFNELLYTKHLLIDQRGTRGRDAGGRLKNGKEHRHPTFRGKAFFFLDPTVDRITGDRYYQTKVRPGTPEVALAEYLVHRGLTANRNAPRALVAVTS